jgi:hypothetical protein
LSGSSTLGSPFYFRRLGRLCFSSLKAWAEELAFDQGDHVQQVPAPQRRNLLAKQNRTTGVAPPLLGTQPAAGFKVVSASYFRAVRLRLAAGRLLDEHDRDGAPLSVVINERMARTYFQGVSPVGQRLLLQRTPFLGGLSASGPGRAAPAAPESDWTIVGVIQDEGVSPFNDRAPEPAVYATREPHPRRNLALLIRTAQDPRGVQESIRKAVAAFDPDQALVDLKTLDDIKSDDVAPDRLRSVLLGTFAAIRRRAGGAGSLRRHGARRRAAHAGNRDSRRAWRHQARCAAARHPSGDGNRRGARVSA